MALAHVDLDVEVSVQEAMDKLGIKKTALYQRMRQLGIQPITRGGRAYLHCQQLRQLQDEFADTFSEHKKRERTQLTIQASPDLIAKVKALADQRRQTITSVVVDAIEAWVEGNKAIQVDPSELQARVDELEQRVERLEAAA